MAGFILLLLQVAAGMGLPSSHNAGSISDWQHQSMVMPADPCYSRAVRSEPEAGKTSTPAALRHRQTYQLARLAAVVRGLCAKHLASAGLRQAEMLLDQGTATIFAPLDTSETDELYRLMLRLLAHHEPGAWP